MSHFVACANVAIIGFHLQLTVTTVVVKSWSAMLQHNQKSVLIWGPTMNFIQVCYGLLAIPISSM